MTCLCLPRLRALVGHLVPTASLRVALPPAVASLNAALSALPPGAGAGGLSLQAAMRLGLPPLPQPSVQIEQIAASATAVQQLAIGFGIDPLAAGGPSRLVLALRSLRLHLPQVPLPPVFSLGMRGAMSLALALSTIARVRAMFGIDLLAPGAALALKAALAASVPPPPMAPVLALRIAAYAKLAAAAQAFGGVGRLMPALQMLARLELPSLDAGVGPLAMLSLFLGLQASIRSTLGLDPSAPDLQLRLAAALRPLAALPPIAIGAALSTAAPMPSLPSSFALDAQAIAGLGLGALASLRLPNLAPLSLAASVSAAAGLASPDCCAGA